MVIIVIIIVILIVIIIVMIIVIIIIIITLTIGILRGPLLGAPSFPHYKLIHISSFSIIYINILLNKAT